MMSWQRSLRLATVLLFAATVMVGFQAQWAEARGFRGGSHRGFHHQGFGHHGFHRHGHHFRGSSFFLGLGLGLVGAPYAYSGYYQPYRSYPAYSYAPYPAYYGACYAYDAYGRCLSYAPAGGYYYSY
ncbi:MAG: hypothetical protein HYY12_04070 [Candidatus Methylomirabilis oxyfera]|nr:hypothetical protein [Candidatus Methylomirabilis oxyfera]